MLESTVKASKFLSLVLRHQPARLGLTLDHAGWVPVAELLAACRRHGVPLTLEQLREIVRSNDKQRFAFSADGRLIRANQGHSVEVDLGYAEAQPPAKLFHGTAERFLASILGQRLVKGRRHHVHLSAEVQTALTVGRRYGKPVVLVVDAGQMSDAGHRFYVSANGVWLTEHVPVVYLQRMSPSAEGTI